VLVAAAAGFWSGNALDRSSAEDKLRRKEGPAPSVASRSPDRAATRTPAAGDYYLQQSPEAKAVNREDNDYGLGDCHVSRLKPYPPAKCGEPTPFDLWRYAGRGASSWSPPTLDMPWEEWGNHCRTQNPKLIADCRAYMNGRYDFNDKPIPGARMSGGKPIMMGPVARLPQSVNVFEELARLRPEEIKSRDLFPYKPLAHPLQTTAHMVFPEAWIRVHPEHERMDCDFDIPDAYLPEFPPP